MATQAAGSAVGKTTADVANIRKETFATTGLKTKQDQDLFTALFDDALGTCQAYSKQQLPSEAAAAAAV